MRGWDAHGNLPGEIRKQCKAVDQPIAALLTDLRRRGLLDDTLVVWGGEFGRTPWVNPLGGRDHWPSGFSMALAGGGIQGGRVIGETSPNPKRDVLDRHSELRDSHPVEDVHATILGALGVNCSRELDTPIGRPMKICEGKKIGRLFS